MAQTRRNSIFIILLFFTVFSYSVENKIDSLKNVLLHTKEDSIKINVLNSIAKENLLIAKYDSAFYYANLALEYALKIDYFQGEALSYHNMGAFYQYKNNFPEAIINYSLSLKVREKINDKKGIADVHNNLGVIYHAQGNYSEALKSFLSSLKIKEEIGDKKGVCFSYNNIGLIYKKLNNYPDALKYYFDALKIAEEIKDKQIISYAHNNIGDIYRDKKNYSEALKNYSISLKTKQELGDKRGIVNTFISIGILNKDQEKYNEALNNFNSSLEIAQELNDNRGKEMSLANIGVIYFKIGKYILSQEFLNNALKLAKESGDKVTVQGCYSALAEIDSTFGNYKSAFENYKYYIVYRDSLLNEENSKKAIQAQMNYDFDKKEAITKAAHEKQIAIAESEKKKQQYVIWSVAGGLLIMIFFSGLIFRKNKEIEKRKNEVEKAKEKIEEHQKEIIDSITYAKRLQQAILPPTELIKKYFPDSFVLYNPKDIVAGDFYWMETCAPAKSGASVSGEEIVFIAAADCTGHGVPGAMVSVVCSNALNRAVKEFGLRDTGKILDKVTDLVLETFEKSASEVKDGMDISLLAYDMTSKQIQWSGANNPLWYIHNGQVVEIKADKQPVGKFDKRKSFTAHSIEHSDNSVFYLFTDGLPDQFGGPKGKKFMYKRFENNLTDISKLPMDEQQAVLEKSFQDWKGSLEQVDDVTVIGIKI